MIPSVPTLLQQAAQHRRVGRRADAEACCRGVLDVDARQPWALLLLAELAVEQKRMQACERLLRMAADEPVRAGFADHRPEALNRLGMMLADGGRQRDAVGVFRRACELSPADAGVRRNLAKALWLAGELDDAVGAYGAAIALGGPAVADVYRDLISLHHARLDTRAAVAARRAMVAGFPQDLNARSELLVALHYLPEVSPRELFSEHVAWGTLAEMERARDYPGRPREESGSSRVRSDTGVGSGVSSEDASIRVRELSQVRIGYFSGNFRDYPMARFLAPVLRGHREVREAWREAHRGDVPGALGRTAVSPYESRADGTGIAGSTPGWRDTEIILYSDTVKPDGVTALLAGLCDAFVDVSKLSDGELDRRLRADELDLLVDVAGHMDNRRMQVLAGRPARRMASYINYPNTLGVAGWDYRLTDSICDPPGLADELHLEQVIRLDPCAWAYYPMFGLDGEAPEPGESPAVANGHVTFGVFCRPAKIIPEAARLWAAAMAAIPTARLAVLQGIGIDAGRLLQVLTKEGIAEERIELLPPGDRRHYLSLHRRIDILLDSWPYNGMTGTCDALWMGVPVVTLQGDSHVSRVGASLLTAMGMTDCIAGRPGAFVALCAGLASEVKELSRHRKRLRRDFERSPLWAGSRISEIIAARAIES